MSPVDPISPTSSMSVSPTTPTSLQQHFEMPATPSILPASHLPKLMTNFQYGAFNVEDNKRISLQFHLLTPSPLKLDLTPLTAIQQTSLVPLHRRTESISTASSAAHQDSISPIVTVVSAASGGRQENSLPQTSPSGHRRVPSLQRQNAMEGLHTMIPVSDSSTDHRTVELPLRVNSTSSSSTLGHSVSAQAHAETELPIHYPAIADTRGARSRSPINRNRRKSSDQQRQRYSISRSAKFQIVVQSQEQKRRQQHLRSNIEHLSSTLVPLISVHSGLSHPDFPRSLLQYHLLTHSQLDSLARHYHQTLDAGPERWLYPCPIGWGKAWCGSNPPISIASLQEDTNHRKRLVDLNTKRRRLGRFIGLKGCESPSAEDIDANELMDRFEREWREALRRAEEQNRVAEKTWGRRF